jgi:hypothetical protein
LGNAHEKLTPIYLANVQLSWHIEHYHLAQNLFLIISHLELENGKMHAEAVNSDLLKTAVWFY